jgi:hypothetical protein
MAKKRKRKSTASSRHKKSMAKYYADVNRAVKKLLKKKAQLERS